MVSLGRRVDGSLVTHLLLLSLTLEMLSPQGVLRLNGNGGSLGVRLSLSMVVLRLRGNETVSTHSRAGRIQRAPHLLLLLLLLNMRLLLLLLSPRQQHLLRPLGLPPSPRLPPHLRLSLRLPLERERRRRIIRQREIGSRHILSRTNGMRWRTERGGRHALWQDGW